MLHNKEENAAPAYQDIPSLTVLIAYLTKFVQTEFSKSANNVMTEIRSSMMVVRTV